MSPPYTKMEPEYSMGVDPTPQTTSYPTNPDYYAFQEGPQYDMAAESQQASFEHYALHNSPAGAIFPSQVCSNHSSPRTSWGSPDQFRSLKWEPANSNISYLPSATSYPTSGGNAHSRSFDGSESSFHLQQDGHFGVYQTTPYPMTTPDGLPAGSELTRPLSACSSSLGGLKAERDLASPAVKSEAEDEMLSGSQYPAEISRHRCPSPQSSTVDSPTSGGGTPGNVSSSKQDEPYAQLIYRAFMSTPRHAMTLQDLYQWFRENTDKGKSDTKGWQNSIRHNLSMNAAFTKRERRHSGAFSTDDIDGSGRICLTSDAAISENKNAKSTEWYLEPSYEHGVLSTTRFRSKNTPRHGSRHKSGYNRGRDSHSKIGCLPGSPSAGHGGSKKGSHSHGQMGSAGNGSRLRSSRHHAHANNTSSPMHGLTQHYNPSMAAAHHQLHVGHHPLTSMMGDVAAYGAAATAYMDYSTHPTMYADYPHPHTHAHGSESGVDEPMTPEPSYNDGLLLPDLHRVAAPSSSSSNRSYDFDAGYPYPHPVTAAAGGVGVGVYDEMMDRYDVWPEDAAAAYHPQY
jgi:hypothetical protein